MRPVVFTGQNTQPQLVVQRPPQPQTQQPQQRLHNLQVTIQDNQRLIDTVPLQKIKKKQTFEMSFEVVHDPNAKESTALVYVAHTWHAEIEATALQLQHSCKQYGIRMYVIMGPNAQPQTTSQVPKEQPNQSFTVLRPTLQDIRSMYPTGFVSMWASNHWLLMWFARQFTYDYVWSIEYDVRFKGQLQSLWTFAPGIDYVFTDLEDIHDVPKNHYWTNSITADWRKANCIFKTATKQIFRVSNKFIRYLEVHFLAGHNAQDELALASHCMQGNFSSRTLKDFMSPSWTTSASASPKIRILWTSCLDTKLQLFHPVKTTC